MELEQSFVDEYKENGYLIIDTQIPNHVFDGIIEFLEPAWASGQLRGVPQISASRTQDAWKVNKLIRSLSLNPRILSILEQLYDRKPLPFQTLNFPKGTEQSIHVDTLHFNTEPFGLLCGVWIALEDVGADQGPLVFYPKSNKLPEMNFEHIDFNIMNKEAYAHAYGGHSKELEELMHEKGLRSQLGLMKKGQAIIWQANLIHGGSVQNDKNLTRHSQVTHYLFEGSRYWRPLFSKDKREYFKPNWIV
jgi:ectoine hydroxylase-related dioxygenase (phytanoyl-CoA dioxygenase family)